MGGHRLCARPLPGTGRTGARSAARGVRPRPGGGAAPGPARDSRRRDRPPRPQALQRSADRRRPPGHRLRHRPRLPGVGRIAADQYRHGHRLPGIHGARTDPRRGDRARGGRLLPRLCADVRDRRTVAVRGRCEQPARRHVPDRPVPAGPERRGRRPSAGADRALPDEERGRTAGCRRAVGRAGRCGIRVRLARCVAAAGAAGPPGAAVGPAAGRGCAGEGRRGGEC